MQEQTKVIEVQKVFTRETTEEKSERIIFEMKDGVWVYHAPNAQDHTIEQLELILSELKKLTM